MKNKLGLRILLTSIALVTIAICTMVLSGLTDRPKINKGNNGMSLEAPLFISSAEAAQATKAFPADEAGIAAYVKVSTVDIEKIKPIFTKLERVGDNYIVGVTYIKEDKKEVNLYADTDGWFVAYLKTGEPAAKIMQWSKGGGAAIQSTTLEDTLNKAGSAANVEIIPGSIKYYHFKYPEANNMMLFVKEGMVQVELPATYALYEASYDISIYDVVVKLDGSRMNSGFYASFKTGKLHTIEGTRDGTEGGFATMLIYKVQ